MSRRSIIHIEPYACLLLMGCLFIFCTGCGSPSEIDVKKMQVLDDVYGEKYFFRIKGEFYLEVRSRKDLEVNESELREIYKLFIFDKNGTRRRDDTGVVYLNYYDSTNTFQYQLYFDPEKNEFKKSHQPHY